MNVLPAVNVLLCTRNYLRLGAELTGGVERLSLILVQSLRKRGCCFSNAYREIDDGTPEDDLDEHYFGRHERIRITDSTTSDQLTSFLLAGNIRVIHVQQARTRDFLLFREAAERAGAVLIATMHEKPFGDMFLLEQDMPWQILREKRSPEALKRFLFPGHYRKKLLNRLRMNAMNIFGLCHRVVLVSRDYLPGLENLLQRELQSGEYTVIPNCVGFSNFFPEQHIARLKIREVLAVCSLDEPTRRVGVLLDLWRELADEFPDWTLRIIGDGPSGKHLMRQARKIPRVIMDGRQDPLSFYRTSSVFVSLGVTSEAWSMSLLEAMQNAAVPVVFNTSEAFGGIIDNEVNGFLVDDMDLIRLKGVLRMLLEDEGYRRKAARAALGRARMYGQLTFCRNYFDLYRSTIRDPDRS